MHRVTLAEKFIIEVSDSFRRTLNLRLMRRKGPKFAQNEVFQVLSKINAWYFSDFLHKVRVAIEHIAIFNLEYLGEKSPKFAQNEVL